MGHERVGYIPKTQRWKEIVSGIGGFTANPESISDIALKTTQNVRTRFDNIEQDKGVFGAFKYLILLSYATKLDNSIEFLDQNHINVGDSFDLFDLGINAKQFIEECQESKEYSAIATQSLMETIATWFQNNDTGQKSLFESKNPLEKWRKASSGEGFCELSRLFFSSFTKRYLKYFLEREAAWYLKNVDQRVKFNEKLENYIDDISKHAFETSKITQSFSAAWYNKHVMEKIPGDKRIQGFISFAFKKINSELLREEEK